MDWTRPTNYVQYAQAASASDTVGCTEMGNNSVKWKRLTQRWVIIQYNENDLKLELKQWTVDSKQGHNSVEHLHYNSSHLSSDKQVQQVEQVFDGGGECMEHIKLMTRERKAGDVSGGKAQPLLKSIQNELRRPLLLSLIYIYIIDFCLEN